MRFPGTLRQILEQVRRSPVPISSISIPTEHGPFVLTFGAAPAPAPKAEPASAVEKNPATARTDPPKRAKSDVAGAFTAIPELRDNPFGPSN